MRPQLTFVKQNARGFSLSELLLVVAMISVIAGLAVVTLVHRNRTSYSQNAASRAPSALRAEILSLLRRTRQLAMSLRQAITFQYDDTTKEISIIDHTIMSALD